MTAKPAVSSETPRTLAKKTFADSAGSEFVEASFAHTLTLALSTKSAECEWLWLVIRQAHDAIEAFRPIDARDLLRAALQDKQPYTPQAGDVWREVDPRFERYIGIEKTPEDGDDLRVCFITVVKSKSDGWVPAKHARHQFAKRERFDGRRGGYALHERPAKTTQP